MQAVEAQLIGEKALIVKLHSWDRSRCLRTLRRLPMRIGLHRRSPPSFAQYAVSRKCTASVLPSRSTRLAQLQSAELAGFRKAHSSAQRGDVLSESVPTAGGSRETPQGRFAKFAPTELAIAIQPEDNRGSGSAPWDGGMPVILGLIGMATFGPHITRILQGRMAG